MIGFLILSFVNLKEKELITSLFQNYLWM